MLLFLLLLKLLPFLVLLLLKLLLLLLVFLSIPGIRGSRAFHRRKVIGMDCGGGAASVFSWRRNSSPIGRRVIRRSRLSRRNGFAATELTRFGGSSNWRLAMIRRRPKFSITAGSLHVLRLSTCRGNMPVTSRSFILRGWPGTDTAIPAVEAHPALVVDDDGGVVHIVNVSDIHIRHRAIVEKVVVVPAPTFEPFSEIAEAI